MAFAKFWAVASALALTLGTLALSASAAPAAPLRGGFQGPGAATGVGVAAEAEPSATEIHSPALTRALTTPDRLWAFLTSPDTPYTERRAAAAQGVFPVAWLPRLMAAINALEHEEALHHWGLKVPPFSSQGPRRMPILTPSLRVRHILGHEWTVPATPQDYPVSYAQRRRAPWPWQVQEALENLLTQIAPSMGVRPAPEQIRRGQAWMDAALTMPCTTDDEAVLFVRATATSSHFKTIPVLARWRQIALDPRFPQAAADVASDLGEAARLWDDERSPLLGQIIAADIIEKSPHSHARSVAAWGISQFGESLHGGEEIKRPEPALAVLAAAQAAQDPRNGDAWTRLYYYAFGVCRSVADPPFAPDFGMDPQSPDVATDLAKFAAWFAGRKASLAAEVQQEAGQIAGLRSELLM